MEIREIISNYLNTEDAEKYEALLVETGEEARAKLGRAKEEFYSLSTENRDDLVVLQRQLSGEEEKIKKEIETIQEKITAKTKEKAALETLQKKTTVVLVIIAIAQTFILLKIMELLALIGVVRPAAISAIHTELRNLKEQFTLLAAYKENLTKIRNELDSLDSDALSFETSAEEIKNKSKKLNEIEKIETALKESEQNLQSILSKVECLEDFPIVLEALNNPTNNPLSPEELLNHLQRARESLDKKIRENLSKNPEEISTERIQQLLDILNEGMTETTDPLYSPFTEKEAKAALQTDIEEKTIKSNKALAILQRYSNRFAEEITHCQDLLIQQQVIKLREQLQALGESETAHSLASLHEKATKLLLTAAALENANLSMIGLVTSPIRAFLQTLNLKMQKEISYETLNVKLTDFEILVSAQKNSLQRTIIALNKEGKELPSTIALLYQDLGSYEKQMVEWRELVTRYEELTKPNTPESKKLLTKAFQSLTQKVKGAVGTKQTPEEMATEIAQLRAEFPMILAAIESATNNIQQKGNV